VAAIEGFSAGHDLSPDELISTTRSVRRQLDLTRPVDLTLIGQCLDLAQQRQSMVIRLLGAALHARLAVDRSMSHA
jgi:hypothetical protein